MSLWSILTIESHSFVTFAFKVSNLLWRIGLSWSDDSVSVGKIGFKTCSLLYKIQLNRLSSASSSKSARDMSGRGALSPEWVPCRMTDSTSSRWRSSVLFFLFFLYLVYDFYIDNVDRVFRYAVHTKYAQCVDIHNFYFTIYGMVVEKQAINKTKNTLNYNTLITHQCQTIDRVRLRS